jgi:formate dehydrogenase
MAKVLCVLYDDPVDGYPTSYARDRLPVLERYPGGQSLPTPSEDVPEFVELRWRPGDH